MEGDERDAMARAAITALAFALIVVVVTWVFLG